jgi:hypothetical protein
MFILSVHQDKEGYKIGHHILLGELRSKIADFCISPSQIEVFKEDQK